MADIPVAERIMQDVIWEPVPGLPAGPFFLSLIAAVILITLILIRSMIKRKRK